MKEEKVLEDDRLRKKAIGRCGVRREAWRSHFCHKRTAILR
jgi:hypothetical protein